MLPSRSARAVIGLSILFGAIVFLAVRGWLDRERPLVSDPHAPRPWADDRFRELTRPVPSAGNPRDARFASRCDPLTSSRRGWETRIDLPRDEFVPDYELIEFAAGDGFVGRDFRGEVRWMGAVVHEPDPEKDWDQPVLAMFRADGSPLPETEHEALGIGGRERNPATAWTPGRTCFRANLALEGCENPALRLRDVFDAETHVILSGQRAARMDGDGAGFGATLDAVHGAHLLAVLDVAHGATREQTVPFRKGAVVEDPAFRLEVLEVSAGWIGGASTENGKTTGIKREYDKPYKDRRPGFSLIYQIDPPVMELAVSLEVLDPEGRPMKDQGKFMELMPVWKYEGDLADAAALRVRLRPRMTRLLIHVDPLPGAKPPNEAPADLFDVRTPDRKFTSPGEMRRYIAGFTQLQLLQSSWDPATHAFPIEMKRPSPREVAECYRELPGDRKVKVDPVAMTVEFESPKHGPSLWTRIADWLRARGWWP